MNRKVHYVLYHQHDFRVDGPLFAAGREGTVLVFGDLALGKPLELVDRSDSEIHNIFRDNQRKPKKQRESCKSE